MDAPRLLQRLTVFPAALQTLCEGVADDDHSWRPEDGGWCLRELVAHLADEEGEDFRARLEFVLDEREGAFDSIDPEGWVAARRYRDRPVAQSLERFAAARVETLARLRKRLDAAGPSGLDWSLHWTHPRFADLHAGDLLGALAAHDALHLRQLARLLHSLAERDAAPYEVGYAGSW